MRVSILGLRGLSGSSLRVLPVLFVYSLRVSFLDGSKDGRSKDEEDKEKKTK